MPRKGSRKAVTGFLHADPVSLHWSSIHLIISGLHEYKGEALQQFKECVVFIEDSDKTPKKGLQPTASSFESPQLILRRVSLDSVKELLEEKIRHEEQSFKRKHPGTPSTRAPIYLTPDTYVFCVGSIEFMQTLIGLFFSEEGAAKLRELFIKATRLREWKSTKKLDTNTFFEYDTEDERFDACNFDALAEKLRLARKHAPYEGNDVLSPEEVQLKLFGKSRMAAQD